MVTFLKAMSLSSSCLSIDIDVLVKNRLRHTSWEDQWSVSFPLLYVLENILVKNWRRAVICIHSKHITTCLTICLKLLMYTLAHKTIQTRDEPSFLKLLTSIYILKLHHNNAHRHYKNQPSLGYCFSRILSNQLVVQSPWHSFLYSKN